MAGVGLAHAVGDGEHQHRHCEGKEDADHPGEFDVVGMPIDVHEPFEHVDRRDRDDRAKQLLLEVRESDLDQAVGPSRIARGIERRDEVLVARPDHDHDQVGHQREVDQVEDGDDHVCDRCARDLHHGIDELDDELVEQRRQADDQPQQERHHQPTAVEDDRLDPSADVVHAVKAPDRPMAPLIRTRAPLFA